MRLEETLNSYGEQGWRFHSVFTVESRGCLGLLKQTTNFMVLEAAWARDASPSGLSSAAPPMPPSNPGEEASSTADA